MFQQFLPKNFRTATKIIKLHIVNKNFKKNFFPLFKFYISIISGNFSLNLLIDISPEKLSKKFRNFKVTQFFIQLETYMMNYFDPLNINLVKILVIGKMNLCPILKKTFST